MLAPAIGEYRAPQPAHLQGLGAAGVTGRVGAQQHGAEGDSEDTVGTGGAVSSSHQSRVADGPLSFAVLKFLILGQNYAPELVELRVNPGTAVDEALGRANAARSLDDIEVMPRLVVVDPQPFDTHAVLISAPIWASDGVLVLLDCSPLDGRVFALQLPSRLTRVDILVAAGFDSSDEYLVFIRGQPWGLPNGVRIDILEGDLFTISNAMLSGRQLITLMSLLQTPSSWCSDPVLPGIPGERAWIIAQAESFSI